MFYRNNKILSIWKQTGQFSKWGSQTEDEQTESHICNKEKGKTQKRRGRNRKMSYLFSTRPNWKNIGEQWLLIIISVIREVKVGIWRWTKSLLPRGNNTPLPYLFTPSSLSLSVRIHPSFLHPLSTFSPLPLRLSTWNPAPQTNHK